jgi:hypothetical protein
MCVIPVVCVTNKEGGEVKQHNVSDTEIRLLWEKLRI